MGTFERLKYCMQAQFWVTKYLLVYIDLNSLLRIVILVYSLKAKKIVEEVTIISKHSNQYPVLAACQLSPLR